MQLLHFIRTFSTGLLLLAAMQVAAQSTTLDSLPQKSQDEISRVCLPVQFREGASAYRNCVQAELDLRSTGGTNEMANLSFDDKYAVQQACAKAGGQSSSAYQSCVSNQISELNSISAPIFDNVREDELYVIQQTCFNAQSKQGAASYRSCLNTEVENLLAIPAADTSKLNMLNKNALQLRCSANTSRASQYRQCIAAEFESIAGTEPNFLPVGTAAQVVSKSEVPVRKSVVNETVTSLAKNKAVAVKPEPAPKPEPSIAAATSEVSSTSSAAMALPRNINPPQADSAATQLVSAQSNSANRNTLRDATGDDRKLATTQVSTRAVSSVEPRVISRPNLVKELEEQRRAEAQGIEIEKPSANTATTDSAPTGTGSNIMPRLRELWQMFLDSLASLDSKGWLIIAGVLALPALLLGLFSLARRNDRPVANPVNNPALTERIEPGMQTRKLRHEREAAELFGDHEPPQQNQSPLQEPAVQQNNMQPPTAAASADVDPDHDAVTRIAMKHEQPIPRQQHEQHNELQSELQNKPALRQQQSAEQVTDQQPANEAHDFAWQSAFGHWLTQQPASSKLEACVEFLIYWVAYGDERYEPELKKRLFTAQNLSTHDQIKRWVLKQDVFAFSDVISWLRANASQKQLDQCLALIMALLVTENSVTPVQNTLLRFLSDAFNIGKDELEQRFETAFGHNLPAMPRPDKEAWWSKQDPESVQRWNSRALASRPQRDQMIARLGLSPGFDDAQVINAFRRAARRCHPDRFTDLGERERALAEQRFIKFEEARDKLLGVSV